MSTVASSLIIRLIDKVTGPARDVTRSIRTITDTARGAGRVGAAVDRVNASVRRVRESVSATSAAVSVPLGMIGRYGFQAAYNFEKLGNKIQAVTGITDQQRASLNGYIKELNTLFPYTNAQIAGAALELSKAGLKYDQVIGTLKSTLTLGLAGDIELSEAADIATNVMTALRLPMETTEQASRSLTMVVDRLAYAANNSNTDVRLMGETMKYVAPMAAAAGLGIDEVTAAAMTMANNGIKGAEAGVALRSALVRMVRPTKPMWEALNALNIELSDFVRYGREVSADAVVSQLGMSGIDASALQGEIQALLDDKLLRQAPAKLVEKLTSLIGEELGSTSIVDREALADNLRDALAMAGSEIDLLGFVAALREKGATLGDIARVFDSRQGARLITLLTSDLDAMSDTVAEGAEGAAQRMADAMQKGIVGAVAALQAQWENLFVTIGETGVLGTIANAMRQVTASLEGLAQSNPALLEFGTYALIALAAIGPLGLMMAGTASAVGMLIAPLRLMGSLVGLGAAGFATLVGGLRRVPAAAAPAAASMSLVNQNLQRVTRSQKVASAAMIAGMGSSAAASSRMVAGMTAAAGASAALGSGGGRIRALGGAFLSLLNPLKLVRVALTLLKVALISTGLGAILVAIGSAGAWIYQNWEGLGRFFTAFGQAFMEAIGPLAPLVQPLIDAFSWLWDAIASIFTPLDQSSAKWAEWGAAAGQWAGEVVAALARIVSDVAAWVGEVVGAFADLAAQLFTAGVEAFTALWEGMKSVGEAIVSWAAGLGSRIASGITGAVSGAVDWLSGKIGGGTAAPSVSGASELPEARAGGGSVYSGRTYLVGEEGPEIFRPRGAGDITTAGETASALAGGRRAGGLVMKYAPSISLVVHEATGDVRAAVREFAETLAREFEVQTRAAFADEDA